MRKIKRYFYLYDSLFFENVLPDDPCLKIKYTLEEKISLNSATPQKTQGSIKQKRFFKAEKVFIIKKIF